MCCEIMRVCACIYEYLLIWYIFLCIDCVRMSAKVKLRMCKRMHALGLCIPVRFRVYVKVHVS